MTCDFHGELRLNPNAKEPWRYQGTLDLPSGRYCVIRARVSEDEKGRFFQIEGGLEAGMTAAELEAVLTQVETERAQRAWQELATTDELPF